jgi:hypothetical protein
MSLDVYLYHTKDCRGELYWRNITHNMGKMASKVDLYKPLWRPDEIGVRMAGDLIPLIEDGLEKLINLDEETISECTPSNGWGNHEGLVNFTKRYLEACKEFPDAYIYVSR